MSRKIEDKSDVYACAYRSIFVKKFFVVFEHQIVIPRLSYGKKKSQTAYSFFQVVITLTCLIFEKVLINHNVCFFGVLSKKYLRQISILGPTGYVLVFLFFLANEVLHYQGNRTNWGLI